MSFVILRNFLVADGDMRADLAADDALGKQGAANVVLKILPVHSLAGDGLFKLLHAAQLVLGADGVESFDELRLYAHAHVLGALNEKRLINEIAQGVFLAVFDVGLQLFRRAAVLTFGLGVFLSAEACLLVFGAGNDFIVNASDDFLNGLAGIRIDRLR